MSNKFTFSMTEAQVTTILNALDLAEMQDPDKAEDYALLCEELERRLDW